MKPAPVSTIYDAIRAAEPLTPIKTVMTKFMHRYMDRVLQLATRSVEVRRVLLNAFSLLAPPTTLFQPRVLFRVLLAVLKGKADENAHRNHGGNRSLDRRQPATKDFADGLFAGRSQAENT